MTTLDRNELINLIKAHNGNVLLYGPPGTGKTTLGHHAARDGQAVYSHTCTMEQPAAEGRGHYIPNDRGSFDWHDGSFVRAWREAGLLILNEINHASEDMSNVLHAILDDPDVARLTLPTRETITPAAGFRVIATMNGTLKDLAPALLDRFQLIARVDQPSADMLAVLPDDIRAFCTSMYAACARDGGDPEITYRQLRSIAAMRASMDMDQAALLATGDPRTAAGIVKAIAIATVKK